MPSGRQQSPNPPGCHDRRVAVLSGRITGKPETEKVVRAKRVFLRTPSFRSEERVGFKRNFKSLYKSSWYRSIRGEIRESNEALSVKATRTEEGNCVKNATFFAIGTNE